MLKVKSIPAKSPSPAGGLPVLTTIPQSPSELRCSHGKLTFMINFLKKLLMKFTNFHKNSLLFYSDDSHSL